MHLKIGQIILGKYLLLKEKRQMHHVIILPFENQSQQKATWKGAGKKILSF